jgi:hypothetical protein
MDVEQASPTERVRPAKWPYETWKVPVPYGYARAVDTASSVAVPLLVGFSVALIVLVLDRTEKIRWPDVALLLLTGATISLVMAIQMAFAARQYVVTPDEIEAWWPDLHLARRWQQQRARQFGHAELLALWIRRFRLTYNLGILLFLAALPVVLLPPATSEAGTPNDIDAARWAAIGAASAGVIVEFLWVIVNALSVRYGRMRWDEARPFHARVFSRFVLALVPATREGTPEDVKNNAWPDWFTPEEQEAEKARAATKERGSAGAQQRWPDVVAEAVLMLSVLYLVAVAVVVGWVIGHYQ